MRNLTTDLCTYLPPWFREIGDFDALCSAERIDFEALAQAMEAVNRNFFFQEMDLQSVGQWEPLFGIVPNPSTETLEFRRARLLNRISSRPPFTLSFLREKLDHLVGKDAYTIDIDYPNYTLYIESSAQDQMWQEEIWVTIQTVKPCHIVYINRPYLAHSLSVAEQVNFSWVINNYRLGAWALGKKPFANIQTQGVIVTESQRSIQTALLHQTASFIAQDVASVLLNGTVSITELKKSTDGEKVKISYFVSPADAELVTQEALLDSDGRVLTSSPVYVPVSSTTQFMHVITIRREES